MIPSPPVSVQSVVGCEALLAGPIAWVRWGSMARGVIVSLAADASVESFINARAFFAAFAAILAKRHWGCDELGE